MLNLNAQIYKTIIGSIYFVSDAPLELIEAKSVKLQGIIDGKKKTFAFSIPISSFEGFNSPLQREHFNENYMESQDFSNATFTGKIIEKIDFAEDGKYTIRAKGKLTIHGVEQERIIKSQIEIKKGKLFVNSNFTVLLVEHKIRVPKIVYQKIAKEIKVNIKAEFEKS
jgi:hypothetical protein